MPYRIIAKFSFFVISAFVACFSFVGCSSSSSEKNISPKIASYERPKINGTVESSDLTESSGIAASKCQNDVFWTHNDSGDAALIYALDGRGGRLGAWRIPNAGNIDWEDIATFRDKGGKCFVYIGEIGDNRTKRPEHIIYRIPEPIADSSNRSSSRAEPTISGNAEMLRYRYVDYNQDAETLMVHPKSGDIYVITKRVSGPAGVYKIAPDFSGTEVSIASRVAEIAVPAIPNGFITGGDISPDGRRVILCDYTQAYEFVLQNGELDFEEIWHQSPESVDLGKRKGGESICYSLDGSSIFATSEGVGSPVIEVRGRR